MTYREWATGVAGVVVWANTATPGGTTILPDGCVDLVWDGERLAVAGPDTRARHHTGVGRHVGLRFSHGLGPGALGVAADALRDATADLDAVWAPAAARELTERVAADPVAALAAWVRGVRPADPFGARVFAAAAYGVPVGTVADHLGVTTRTLHRRCLPVFGYGAQHLGRVLRLQRALAGARRGLGWAAVAAETGYADQAHLARDARALTGTTPTGLLGRGQVRRANRSTVAPSGSWTTA